MSELPEGWVEATLQDLIGSNGVFSDGDWIETKDQDVRGDVRLIQLADVGDGIYKNRSSRFLASETADRLGCTYLLPGDLLIARMPEPIGRACIYPGDPKRAITAVDVCIVRPTRHIANSWLMFAINSPQFRAQLENHIRGTTRKRISRANLAALQINVPPLAEQRRIVERVEALLARVRDARVRLNRADMVASDVRASLLGKMCEQRQAWPSIALRDVTSDIRYGTAAKCDYDTSGVPVLRIPNVQSGKIDLSDVKYGPLSQDERRKLSLRKGDLLMVRSNGSVSLVGRTAVVSEAEQRFAFAGYLVRIRLDLNRVDPHFIHASLQTRAMRQTIETTARSTSGVNNINSEEILSLPITFPSLKVQREIAQVIANVDDYLERIRGRIDSALDRADALPQAILAKAFAGELVPTEADVARRESRSYEPASVLLERIRAERASAPAAPKRRRATAISANCGARSPRR